VENTQTKINFGSNDKLLGDPKKIIKKNVKYFDFTNCKL